MRRLYLFDTTLRDGEQSLGITLNVREKLEIAKQLATLGVDILEAGFPASSPGDFESVKIIGREVKGITVCGLTRCVKKDIDLCAEALKEAENPRIHTGIAVSPIHMEKKLRLKPEQVIQKAEEAVRHAKKYLNDVEFYAEDAFRSDYDFLAKIFERVIAAGATVVNIPDTVGYATPWEFGELVSYIKTNVPNIDRVKISVHCHNDLGMATANTLAGIMAGADQVEGTINGIGERAGNTALEEVIMAMYTQKDRYGIDLAVNTREIAATSRLVSSITGVPVPSHKAIVGTNAFMHASGIHQDGILKEKQTYEIIDPETIGVPRNQMVLSARSGRHALKHRLEELGYKLEETQMNTLYEEFLLLADKKQEIYDEDLHILMGTGIPEQKRIKVKNISVATAGTQSATAAVTLEIQGTEITDAAIGNGPIDAVFKAIDRIIGKEVRLEDYSIKSVSRGKEALGNATVKIFADGNYYVGKGVSTDVIDASALAYADAVSKLS
ncbi:2-isopropylmalate synthase [Dehalobacter sp. UNSWDHB]|jgi:2-isopropylmalate synthase, bacterial type|uniref:2-isopropylmalate synthase n=1 Tax=unclassified Dehalobacter TaxID=2635733 RepID=UPI00028B710A|nr:MULTISPECIES: 2-isopropylmalate synthase [unclassified Dehalobacter]AFV02755.1 2-isopropylmalate synthase [Dehalobacter sp. DCA]AFV05740.1 2-isopropylmalate synthase [Dehalobacter sp. CF]EQB21083.1 2-isopropylmalate synthase [Dehalobacter sp. UNSWDHB]